MNSDEPAESGFDNDRSELGAVFVGFIPNIRHTAILTIAVCFHVVLNIFFVAGSPEERVQLADCCQLVDDGVNRSVILFAVRVFFTFIAVSSFTRLLL